MKQANLFLKDSFVSCSLTNGVMSGWDPDIIHGVPVQFLDCIRPQAHLLLLEHNRNPSSKPTDQ